MLARKACVGISITDRAIKAAWIKLDKQDKSFRAYEIEPLDEGIIENGRVKDEASLLDALERLVERGNFKKQNVHLALPGSLSTLRFLHFPQVSKYKLNKLIRFEVRHNMFLPYDDPVFDYIILPSQQDDEAEMTISDDNTAEEAEAVPEQPDNHTRILLVTASKADLMQYVDILKKAKLKAKSIELDALALYRFLSSTDAAIADSTCMLLNVSNSQTDVSIFDKGYIQISRSIDINLALTSTTTYNFEFNELASEIERIINFYTYSMSNREHELDIIYMFGDSEHLPDIAKFLNELLNIEVMKANELDFVPPNDLNNMYAVPAGLSLKGVM